MGMTATDRPYIASSHHQAIDDLGLGFKVVAWSLDDQIIEAIEHEKFPNVLGVQFHPEYRKLWDATPEFKYSPDDPRPVRLPDDPRGQPAQLGVSQAVVELVFHEDEEQARTE